MMLQICGHLAACVAKNIQPMKKACAAMAGAGFMEQHPEQLQPPNAIVDGLHT
ncbi:MULTISPECIES: hypothetical protein [Comamonas]|uniref:hypothetical protein n=1 Tax=Comamonas TaxID=283 RepID=UPI0012E323E2|nr:MULTISPECIES: hypothetical protein [Comamonas]UBQ39798.1 hypothetical protein LCH15_13580 [Comamonas thiooxydans]UNV88586.1 hypothetical protein MP576_13040 [Comamonas sp. 7D-2evo1]UNV93511.1 hypothetical protein MPZ60_13330 [Comamonas sp. 7D-2]UNV98229.1 hypothetical protein MP579_13020 [Comamonas sp. 7D-2evo2]